ncbi:hypothetical protein RDI61_01845 [Pseudomonas plecoglossicida]|uniref:hypothetical protein n=1 Tax=Pseudomonas putida group TaxID=136845 RepID=UPI0024100FDD|nr:MULTISPECIES: hypothetical protein [Pseudomonas putida group]MDQ7962795.1 hypothetical protein [Pseudomonas plecoglossicida]WFG05207.1 hypothetical protein P3X84_11465 [Pseudomonas putida]
MATTGLDSVVTGGMVMALLFVVALVLAWPTYGLSLVAWLAIMLLKSAAKIKRIKKSNEIEAILNPLFSDNFADFFRALDVPFMHGYANTDEECRQCGRHIMNYLCHNPEEAAIFVKGLKRWGTNGYEGFSDPVVAASAENEYDTKAEIHLTSYRAIDAIMTNNKGIKCFGKVDYGKLLEYKVQLELAGALKTV